MSGELQSKLEDLAGTKETKDGALVLGRSGTVAAMPAILRAIDNTILPRLLELSVGTTSISVLAGGRRLRAVLSTTDDLSAAGLKFGDPLSRDDTETQKLLRKVFETLASKEGDLTLLRKIDKRASDQSDGGLDMHALARSWDVDLNAAPPTALAQFLSGLDADLMAYVEFNGDAIASESGKTDLSELMKSEKLQGQITDLTTKLSQNRRQRNLPEIMVLSGHLPEEAMLCVLKHEETKAFIATANGSIPSIARAWNLSKPL